jgi:protein HIRA/HIR1
VYILGLTFPDSYIRIWSTEAIYNSATGEEDKPRQLAALSTHSGTIHTVRFSPSNKFLASGADDKIVCIYGLDPNPPTQIKAFGSKEAPPVENWRVLRRLVGHDNDVQDLAWSYDASILVTVGLDSKVVVWSGHTFEKLKTLSQHLSHVKGITFDPANKYFATASDDRTIKIWRFTSPPPNATAHDQINNFMLETTINAPFVASPLTTYFRRCSWSPDGLHIAAANAVNGPVSSVAIIARGSWDSSINFIGHEGPVEVCAFNPRMFYQAEPDPQAEAQGGNQPPPVTVIACGGQDKALSIWNTRLTRPFVIAQDVATKSISDLAWTPDGEKLFISTLDGGIFAVIFEPGELGYVASLSENDKALNRFGAGRKAGIVEGVDSLLLEELSKADELKGVVGRMGELMGDSSIATLAVNGSAVAEPKTNGTNGTTTPTAGQTQEAKITQLKQRVEIVGGKKRVKPLLISSGAAPTSSLPQSMIVANTMQSSKGASDNPHAVLDLSKPYDGFPKGGLVGLLVGNKRKFAEIVGDEEKRTEKRVQSLVKDGGAPILVNGETGLQPPSKADREAVVPIAAPLAPAIIDPALTVSQLRLAVPVLRSVIIRTVDGSEPPKPNETTSAAGEVATTTTTDSDVVMLEARNATGNSRTGRPQDRDPTRINCTRSGLSQWQDYLPAPVSLVTGNSHFWAAGCNDGTIHVWTPSGRRLLNALVLEAQPVIMDCRGWNLLVITAVGMCRVWNLKTLSCPHPPVSLAPVLDVAVHASGPHLTGTPGIVFARLSSEGRVVVATTNGDGFAYHPGLFVWQRMSEPWFAVGSQYWNTTDSSVGNVQQSSLNGAVTNGTNGDKAKATVDNDVIAPENISAGIIPLLERNTTAQTLLRGRAFHLQRLIKALLVAEGFEGFEASVSVAHLENRLASAMSLGAREEFKIYLQMYAKRLGAEGLKAKIEELLRTLLGDVYSEQGLEEEGKGWQSQGTTLCGWERKDLLKDVVLILGKFGLVIQIAKLMHDVGKHRDIQRLTVPYARLLGVVDQRLLGSTEEDVMKD